MAITALGVIVVIGMVLYHGYTTTPGWVGVSDKKFWDYLDLLIVPAALAIGVYLLDRAQSEREHVRPEKITKSASWRSSANERKTRR